MTSPSTTKTSRPVIALVAAAGQGTRLGANLPKAYVELAGQTLLERSVRALHASGAIDRILVLVTEAMQEHAQALLDDAPCDLHTVDGKGERADTVWAGLQAIPEDDATVLIHDAARALTPPEMIARVAHAITPDCPAAVPTLPVTDTIKIVKGEQIESTPDRKTLQAVQTPQAFDIAKLRAANHAYFSAPQGFVATDDASLMEWFGEPVRTVKGDTRAFKITTPIDLTLAQALLEEA